LPVPIMHCHETYITQCCNYQEHLNSKLVAHYIREFCSKKRWNIFLSYCSRKVFSFNLLFYMLYKVVVYFISHSYGFRFCALA
jgi:hypothetical protein